MLILYLWIWILHAGIAAISTAPIVFLGRKRVHWSPYDLLAFVLPFSVWLVLMESSGVEGKSLANLGEPLYFSLSVPAAALMRVIVGNRVRVGICSISLVMLLCLVATCVYWWTPALPE